jgi:cyclopropane fatty-acyl-phospholipid synthase-like methyltransferase
VLHRNACLGLAVCVFGILLIHSKSIDNAVYTQCIVNDKNIHAVQYVGTRPTGGVVQLTLLLMEDLQKDHYVLEIGCGALMGGIPIMSYIEKGHYVGLDPNSWLKNQTLLIPENALIIKEKSPLFVNNLSFDATSTGILFDYVFAHSIMSHAAHWQLPLFFEQTFKVLKKNGKVIFSIRLTEPNEYGNEGAPKETRAQEWQYPGCSFFDESTVIQEASKLFQSAERKKDFTAALTADDPGAFHDWFVLTK